MPMHRLLLVATVLSVGMIVACGHAPHEAQKEAVQKHEPQTSAKEVVTQFFKMEAEGRWLDQQHGAELVNFLSNTSGEVGAPEAVYVLKGYTVGNERKDARAPVSYSVEVDYDEWGKIDTFLNFNSAEDEERTYETLYLSNRGWRISLFPFTVPRVNVGAAMRWVVEMRDKSDSPAIRHNAEKALVILKNLSAGGPAPPNPAQIAKESAAKVVARFMHVEKGLLPEQWNQLESFFVETPKPQWSRVHVADIVDVGTSADSDEDIREVDVSTNSLGDLDASLRLKDYPSMRLPLTTPSASACFGDDRFGFSLFLTEKHWEISTDGAFRELDGPPAWKIEDTAFQPLITLDTAIRYVKQASDKTTDPIAKRNAAKTLRVLNSYKRGEPLPQELFSDEPGGCS